MNLLSLQGVQTKYMMDSNNFLLQNLVWSFPKVVKSLAKK